MHLRSLRVRGFKSFAEPVELHFEPGIGVVVGPNGSGKSNVVEAIQWAMASQAPSDLRLESAGDVLFAGSVTRQPSGICEVELILDNTDGTFGTGRPEISVMRRLGREGTSAYLLNRVPVRRLDVQEALADAGLGRELHAVIGQGKVEEILLSRPADRRGLIEEAAGLGKYKRRRHRALGKLRRVEESLARARDVERELAARLRPLALQATAAERAALLAGEADRLRLDLLASELAAARRGRQRLAASLREVSTGSERVEAALAATAAERRGAEQELAGLAGARERAAERAFALRQAADRVAARASALEERAAGLDDDRRRLAARGERLDEQARGLQAAADAAATAAEEHAGRLAAIDDGTAERELASLDTAAAAAQESALEARRALAELDGRAARAETEARDASARALAARERLAALATRRAAGAEARAARAASLVAAQAAATAAGDAVAVRQAEAAAARAAAETARETERSAAAERATAAEHARAARARAGLASAAVERGDGLGPAAAALSAAGVVLAVDLVEADPGLELAVAAALHWRGAQALAADAATGLDLLAQDGLDGASLVVADRPAAPQAPRVGRPLASLVRLGDGAPARLLEGVHLVADEDELARVDVGIAVLRDGRGVDADRGVAFRVGDGQAAALAARREAREAAKALTKADAALTAADVARLTAVGTREAAEELERTAVAAAEAARRAADGAERGLREARRADDAAALEDEALEARAARAAEEAEEASARAEAAGAEGVTLGAERTAAAERAERLAGEHAAAEERRSGLAEQVAAVRAERAALGERAERARAERERLAAEAGVAIRRALAARERGGALLRLLAAVPPAVAALVRAGTRAAALHEPEAARLRELETRAGELGAVLARCTEADAGLQREARDAAARRTALEVEAAQVDERLTGMLGRRRELLERVGEGPVERTEPLPEEDAAALAVRLSRVERRLETLGAVNPLAREEYEAAKGRADETAEQIADLEASLRELSRLVRDLTRTIAERFEATFSDVERGFAEVVETVFPGGRGRLRLVDAAAPAGDPDAEGADDADDEGERLPLEPGVELEISPAGKRIQSLQMLSGGEKALAAIAFLFALMLARPCPFYVLDEVEAALDETNIERFLALVERFRDRAQFVVITHQKRTMEAADVLYGVTMAGDGVSRVLSRRLPPEGAARREVLEPA